MAKRKNKKRKVTPEGSRLKTIAAALILGALSAFGLWRCFDDDPGSPLDPASEAIDSKAIDLGNGKAPDPTLVNESDLLRAEDTLKAPEEEINPEEAASAAENENNVSIEEAGEKIEEKTEEEELEEKYPLHAVAFHFHTQVKAEPKRDSRVVAYARRGSTFRVSERVSTKGCKKGWHEIAGGGYICDGNGVNVARTPVTFAPSPPEPKLDSPLPYEYLYAKADGTPEFWRLPTVEEIKETEQIFRRLERREKRGTQSPSEPPAAIEKKDKDALAAVLAKASKIANMASDGGVDEAAVDEKVSFAEEAEEVAATLEEESEPEPQILADGGVVDPYAIPAYVHLQMAKGYFVSVDDTVSGEDRTFRRTVRGRLVEKDKLYPAKPSTFEGVLLSGRTELPLAFVVGGGVKMLVQEKENGPLKAGSKVSRYTQLPMLGKLKRNNKRYVQVGENEYLPARVVAVAEKSSPPDDLQPGERWIDVNLTQQTLVAYEGEIPVFATLISSGRKDFDTPEGEFRIYGKHVSITMDDPNGGEEAYSIEDVPWTQYFDEGYALHAAFWHDRFGRVRSHGCVNLTPADARRLFFWTGPHLSAGMHGQISTRENPGTRVVVHK